ncbi:MAG TPA: hypothetical protein VFR70_10585 [Flavobacterium sp.]|nr:hypothetical protein [Flavobacterium sp.]
MGTVKKSHGILIIPNAGNVSVALLSSNQYCRLLKERQKTVDAKYI